MWVDGQTPLFSPGSNGESALSWNALELGTGSADSLTSLLQQPLDCGPPTLPLQRTQALHQELNVAIPPSYSTCASTELASSTYSGIPEPALVVQHANRQQQPYHQSTGIYLAAYPQQSTVMLTSGLQNSACADIQSDVSMYGGDGDAHAHAQLSHLMSSQLGTASSTFAELCASSPYTSLESRPACPRMGELAKPPTHYHRPGLAPQTKAKRGATVTSRQTARRRGERKCWKAARDKTRNRPENVLIKPQQGSKVHDMPATACHNASVSHSGIHATSAMTSYCAADLTATTYYATSTSAASRVNPCARIPLSHSDDSFSATSSSPQLSHAPSRQQFNARLLPQQRCRWSGSTAATNNCSRPISGVSLLREPQPSPLVSATSTPSPGIGQRSESRHRPNEKSPVTHASALVGKLSRYHGRRKDGSSTTHVSELPLHTPCQQSQPSERSASQLNSVMSRARPNTSVAAPRGRMPAYKLSTTASSSTGSPQLPTGQGSPQLPTGQGLPQIPSETEPQIPSLPQIRYTYEYDVATYGSENVGHVRALREILMQVTRSPELG